MKFLTRTITVLVVFNLVTGSFALGQNAPEGKLSTYTISGSVGLTGVIMNGLPHNPMTDPRGYYTATVEHGWTGTVMPTMEGYIFKPVSKRYYDVRMDLTNQDYIATEIQFTISGRTGIEGVVMTGLPGNPVTGRDGTYQATVSYGWSSTVMPRKEGYTFRPASMIYTKVTTKRSNGNYAPNVITFTISGKAGVGGVLMRGLPGIVVTDENGYYSATVNYGWTGTVTPKKEGYAFEPPSLPYSEVVRDLSNQNYIAKPITYTISDVILVRGKPLPGVRVSANNGGGSDITDAQGRYSVKVPYGWSGELTISKEGFAFDPPNISSYTNVRSDIKMGDEFVQPRWPSISRRTRTTTGAYKPAVGRTGSRKVLVIPAPDVKGEDLDAITQDLQVMSYILDEKFKEIRELEGVFVDFGDFFGRDSRDTEAIYLDGYGALFLMEVNFAFTPPPKAQEQEPEETAEDVDPTWQRARQKVFSLEEPTMGGTRRIRSRKGDGAVRLKQLNTELIETLKHAANIRNLKQDEWVIFTVFGKSRQYGGVYEDYYRSAAPRSRTSTSGRSSSGGGGGYSVSGRVSGGSGGGGYGGDYNEMYRDEGMAGVVSMEYDGGMEYGETGSNSLTAMTVRAKKSDVDAFAKGELDFEQFQQTVEIFMY